MTMLAQTKIFKEATTLTRVTSTRHAKKQNKKQGRCMWYPQPYFFCMPVTIYGIQVSVASPARMLCYRNSVISPATIMCYRSAAISPAPRMCYRSAVISLHSLIQLLILVERRFHCWGTDDFWVKWKSLNFSWLNVTTDGLIVCSLPSSPLKIIHWSFPPQHTQGQHASGCTLHYHACSKKMQFFLRFTSAWWWWLFTPSPVRLWGKVWWFNPQLCFFI